MCVVVVATCLREDCHVAVCNSTQQQRPTAECCAGPGRGYVTGFGSVGTWCLAGSDEATLHNRDNLSSE